MGMKFWKHPNSDPLNWRDALFIVCVLLVTCYLVMACLTS
jgi:hypothetical protein